MITDENLLSQSKTKQKDRVSVGYDNVTEVLLDVIQFTQKRHKLLIANIRNADQADYIPRDLPSEEFAIILEQALNEHVRNRRLIFHDTENVRFGSRGHFDVEPLCDYEAHNLLLTDRDAYIEFQTERLCENSLHQRFATQLLKHKHSMAVNH